MAGKLNLTIEQGATFAPPVITWSLSSGTPVDLTGWTAKLQIRPSVDSDILLIELNTENSRITLGGVAGTVQLSIAASDTALFDWNQGTYDLYLYNGSYAKRFLYGNVKVVKAVTR